LVFDLDFSIKITKKQKISMKSFIKNGIAFGFGCLVALFLVEIGLRIHNPFETRIKGNRIVLPANKQYHLINRNIPKLPREIIHTKNSLGFRGPEKPQEGIPNTLSIIAVGGSTTECLYLPDGKDWPAIVGDSLKTRFSRVWINNAGLDGHSTFGHIVLMKEYILPLRPKIVLFLVGRNDIGNTGDSGFESSHIKSRISFSSFENFLKSLSAHSELASLGLNVYRYFRAKSQGLPHAVVHLSPEKTLPYPGKDLEQTLEFHKKNFIPWYEKRLETLITLCEKNNILPIFITQPALFGPGIDPVTNADLAGIAVEGDVGYDAWMLLELYNETTRRICKKMQVYLIDLAKEMPKNSAYYYDYLHYTIEGSQKVAEIIFHHLVPYLQEKFPEFKKTF